MDLNEYIMHCIVVDENGKELHITMNDFEITNHLLDNLYLCFPEWKKVTFYYTDTGNFHCEILNTELTFYERYLNYRRRKRYRLHYLKRNSHKTTNFFDTEIFNSLLPSEKVFCNEKIKRNNSKALLEKWESKKIKKPNYQSFYILSFENENFIKIGITTNLIEHRIFQYCFDDVNVKFPSNVDRNDKPSINIHNSFVYETDNALIIENLIKKEFLEYKTEELREFFYANIQERIMDFLDNSKHLYSSKQILCKKIGFSDIMDFINSQPTWNITKWAKDGCNVVKGNESCNCVANKNTDMLESFYNECWKDYIENMENFNSQVWDYDYIELVLKCKKEIDNIDLLNTNLCKALLIDYAYLRNEIIESIEEK